MIAGEMQHRIKNLFSLASALNTISARSTESKDEMAQDFRSRLSALSAAHDLIHPSADGDKSAVPLDALLTVLLKAYVSDRSSAPSVSIAAPGIMIGESAVTSLAIIVHELATNSAKYGALSVARGSLALSGLDAADEVELVWTEAGGPPQTAPVRQDGFGSMLTEKVVRQLRGTIDRTWTGDGVIVTLRMSKARLAA